MADHENYKLWNNVEIEYGHFANLVKFSPNTIALSGAEERVGIFESGHVGSFHRQILVRFNVVVVLAFVGRFDERLQIILFLYYTVSLCK